MNDPLSTDTRIGLWDKYQDQFNPLTLDLGGDKGYRDMTLGDLLAIIKLGEHPRWQWDTALQEGLDNVLS